MRKLSIIGTFFVSALCHTTSLIKPVILQQDLLDVNKVEPLTGSTYADLLKECSKKDMPCILARVVSRGNNKFSTHYFDAGKLNALLFKDIECPENSKNSLSCSFNPLNGNPIIGSIDYIVLQDNGGTPLGSDKDLKEGTEKGNFLRSLFDAQYAKKKEDQAAAFYNVAYAYHKGIGVQSDSALALKWYQRAAAFNEKSVKAKAHLALAELYAEQKSSADAIKARHQYQQAAQQQEDVAVSSRASLSLAEQYRLGVGGERDFEKALHHYKQADRYGDSAVRALAHMGQAELYRVGSKKIEKDYAKALELYTVGLSYKDNPEVRVIAMHGLAELYRLGGFGVERDYERAVSYYRQAAEQLNNKTIQAIAQAGLGELYRQGGFGIAQDFTQAQKYYEAAIDQQHHIASQRMAQLGMAEIYRCSNGTCVNAVKAEELYNKIIACGDGQCGYPVACNGLGSLYCHGGNGVPKDLSKAVAWYSKATEQNKDGKAQAVAFKELADIYRFSTESAFHDIKQATHFYEKAADQNYETNIRLHASLALGDIFAHGEDGIKRDYEKAVEYYLQVAKNQENREMQERARAALLEIRNSSRSLMQKMDALF